jgi:DNA (cytosine-5)-methyltransferase 1
MPPRLLDLFCGAGGCGVGYNRAGFDVTGVDREPHPDNPHPVIVADALEVLGDLEFLADFDVVHASPPCQAHTTMSNRHRGKGGAADEWPELIGPVRTALELWGGVYVIENAPWMTDFRDIAEAVPPAYTEFIGAQLLDLLESHHAA